jgi:predicted Ser/Thr protein kinase
VLSVTSPSASDEESGPFGRYSLLARIGEGGMGVVHLAEDPQGERVALKVLRPHVVGDDEGRARLAREVTSLRRVQSRRVAEVLDADPWGEQPYVVTRYVQGPSLHERVREAGPLGDEELRALAVGLIEAVIAVHEAGVLHRDIKPSNVLIEDRHDPVLIDFGLAKLTEDSRLTATGWLMGTPGYLAPEVLYGDDATPAADVHAWAATVVFAATGSTPFGRGPSMAVMDRARRGEHDLSGVPEWLQPLLAHCLAPGPGDRPAATEVLARLTGGVPGPSPGAPPTRPITASRPYPPPRRIGTPGPREPRPAPPAGRSTPGVRALLTVGLLAVVAAGLALAPYVAAAVVLVLAWLVRTASWSLDAIADRRALKGERRSDTLVQVLSAPWHLVASLPGTLVLMLATLATGALLTTALWALGTPETRALFVGGSAAALVLWWGPGSRRVRRPVRRVLAHATAPDPSGWTWVAVAGAALVALLLALASGTLWWPDDAAPFDPRDLLPPGF